MKHIVSYGVISESNALIEVGIEFDCLSIEKTSHGYEIQFVGHSHYYQGKDYVEVISSMLKEGVIVVAKGMYGRELKVDIAGATSEALRKIFGTGDIEDVRKKMKAKTIVDFGDGKEDFIAVLKAIEKWIMSQIDINNSFVKDEISSIVLGWESVVEVEMAEDI